MKGKERFDSLMAGRKGTKTKKEIRCGNDLKNSTCIGDEESQATKAREQGGEELIGKFASFPNL